MQNYRRCRTIVVAWWQDEKEWDGEAFNSDLGRLPKFRDIRVAKCLVWKHEADKADLKKAQDFAAKEYGDQGVQVFEYDTDEDCLERAKKDLEKS